MKTFAHHYILLKDTPTHPAGRKLRWHGGAQKFYFAKMETFLGEVREGIYADLEGPFFTVDQVSDPKWFKPDGKIKPFIPAFPSRAALDEFVDLVPDCRLVDDVDECRAINAMLADDGFQESLYEFYRDRYNKFHKLNEQS